MTTSSSTAAVETHTLELDDATITYDVRPATGDAATSHPPILMVGQPMCADGFEALAEQLAERTVVTYDPRGLGRSTRRDGATTHDPRVQARDLHALIQLVGGGEPVDMFASSGGAVTALALVEAHPADLRVLVAHEPPILGILPDVELAIAASEIGDRAYQERGFGAGMAEFIRYVSHTGEYTAEYLNAPPADPAMFGLPTEDDGTRDDPLMSRASKPVTAYEPDVDALRAAPTRIVPGVGETSREIVTGRSVAQLAQLLGTAPVEFRGGHGGFSADEWGTPGDPARFAQQLRDALDG